jgi:hypothetical protein
MRETFPPAVSAGAWADWWWGGPVAPAMLDRGLSVDAATFAAALPAIASRTAIPPANAPWAKLYAAWQTPTEATRSRAFARLVPGDPEFAAALARRAVRQRENFREFVVADSEDEPALVRTMHRQRTGYGVLALHPEGPVVSDAYFVQENRVVADFAAGLFPSKGWLPGRFLLALLPPEAR